MAESSKKRGLLEDFRLQCEVALSVAFETLRWLLRKGLLLPGTHRSSQPPAPHVPDAKVRAQALACFWSACSAGLLEVSMLGLWMARLRDMPGCIVVARSGRQQLCMLVICKP